MLHQGADLAQHHQVFVAGCPVRCGHAVQLSGVRGKGEDVTALQGAEVGWQGLGLVLVIKYLGVQAPQSAEQCPCGVLIAGVADVQVSGDPLVAVSDDRQPAHHDEVHTRRRERLEQAWEVKRLRYAHVGAALGLLPVHHQRELAEVGSVEDGAVGGGGFGEGEGAF